MKMTGGDPMDAERRDALKRLAEVAGARYELVDVPVTVVMALAAVTPENRKQVLADVGTLCGFAPGVMVSVELGRPLTDVEQRAALG